MPTVVTDNRASNKRFHHKQPKKQEAIVQLAKHKKPLNRMQTPNWLKNN